MIGEDMLLSDRCHALSFTYDTEQTLGGNTSQNDMCFWR